MPICKPMGGISKAKGEGFKAWGRKKIKPFGPELKAEGLKAERKEA